jgi:hypothetical protein
MARKYTSWSSRLPIIDGRLAAAGVLKFLQGGQQANSNFDDLSRYWSKSREFK